MTSGCCASTASPSCCVQSSLLLIMSSTSGVAASDFTLSSQFCLSIAALSASPWRVLVGIGPAVGLDDFERIGRGHENFRQQRVGIKRDRSDQRIELPGGQQLLRRRRCRLRRRRRRRLRRCRLRHCKQQRDRQKLHCQLDQDRLPVLATFARAIFKFVFCRTLSAFAPACPVPQMRFPCRRRNKICVTFTAPAAAAGMSTCRSRSPAAADRGAPYSSSPPRSAGSSEFCRRSRRTGSRSRRRRFSSP